MDESKKLPKRDKVPSEWTWDLGVIFKSDEEFEQSYKELEKTIESAGAYKGTLTNGSESFLKAIQVILGLSNQLETLYVYAQLKNDQDTTNSTYQGMYEQATKLATQANEAISWFEPEVLELPEEKLEQYFSENEELAIYKHFINQ